MMVDGGDVMLVNTSIADSTAQDGGVLRLNAGRVTMINASIANSFAAEEGGAMIIFGGSLTVSGGSSIVGSTSGNDG
eukprot:7386358-Prymnesium_polylepis.1